MADQGRRAPPRMRGATGAQKKQGLNGKRRQLSIENPAAAIAAAVSRFGWQPPAKVGHTKVAAS